MKLLSIAFLFLIVGCTHSIPDGTIIKTQKGKVYRLESGPGKECYFIQEFDTTDIKIIFK